MYLLNVNTNIVISVKILFIWVHLFIDKTAKFNFIIFIIFIVVLVNKFVKIVIGLL